MKKLQKVSYEKIVFISVREDLWRIAELRRGRRTSASRNSRAIRDRNWISYRDKWSARMRRDSVWKLSAEADPDPAPSLASETW